MIVFCLFLVRQVGAAALHHKVVMRYRRNKPPSKLNPLG
jgi:hypothetical protein